MESLLREIFSSLSALLPYKRNVRRFLSQIQKFSCSITSLKVLGYLKSGNVAFLYADEPILDAPLSLSEVCRYGDRIGIEGWGFRFEDGLASVPKGCFPFAPMILKNGVHHMVVVLSYRRGRYQVYDPEIGFTSYAKVKLWQLYQGVHLVCLSTSTPSSKKKHLPSYWLDLIQYGLGIIPYLLPLFIQGVSTFLLLFISILASLLLSEAVALLRLFSFSKLSHYLEKDRGKDKLEACEAYKRHRLLFPSILSSMTGLLISPLFLFQGDACLSVLSLMGLASSLLIASNLKIPMERKLAAKESSYLSGTSSVSSLFKTQTKAGIAYFLQKMTLLLIGVGPSCLYSALKGAVEAISLPLGVLAAGLLFILPYVEDYKKKALEVNQAKSRLLIDLEKREKISF